MPYASCIQTLNDANGTAYGFLENDGLLWQCQWNPQAQRWDKAQVIPGAYGGEKLQALLVNNLWPTSSHIGNQAGNTPGIVLAYRVGSGEAAQVYATLGQWGSDGQLSWSAPLLLGGSGSVTEDIDLRSSGDGTFELISQRREPAAADPGNTLQTITGARSDSELIKQRFNLKFSEATGYQLNNITISNTDPSPTGITFSKDPAPVAPASATAGNTQFDRSVLRLAPSQPVGTRQFLAFSRQPTTLAAQSGEAKTTWNGGTAGVQTNNSGTAKTVFGLPLAQFKMRWSLQVPQSSPPIDWRVGSNKTPDGQTGKSYLDEAVRYGLAVPLKGNWDDPASVKYTLAFLGSFGLAGYGSQSVVNSFGVSLIRERKNESGYNFLGQSDDYGDGQGAKKGFALAFHLKKDLNLTTALDQKRRYITLSSNYQTVYKYDTLSVGQWRASQLQSISSKVITSIGFEYQQRKRYPSGGYLQWSIGASVGESAQKKYAYPKNADQSVAPLPLFLKRWGLSAATLGTIEGLLFQSNIIGKRGFDRTDALNNNEGPSGLNSKNGASRSNWFWGVQSVNALYGVTTSLLPPIWAGIADLKKERFNNGINIKGLLNGRYLIKGVMGGYVNLNDDFTWDPGNNEAFYKSSWQNKFSLDAGLAFPYGINVPILSFQLVSPQSSISPPAPKAPLPQQQTFATLNSPSVESQVSALATQSTPQSNSVNLVYLPASGSTLLPTTDNSNSGVQLLAESSSLQLFTLNNYTGGADLILKYPGQGLNPGSYSDVPILGELLPGSAAATFSFTVDKSGTIDKSTIQIQVLPSSNTAIVNGQYLFLPETSPNSGIYALIPDVISTGILQPLPANSSNLEAIRELRKDLPVIEVNSSTSNAITITTINAVPQMVVVNTSTASGTTSFANPDPSDNSLKTYKDVPVSLNADALNATTASVSLSNGKIVKVVLKDPLYLSSSVQTTSLVLTVDLLSDPDFKKDYNPTPESNNPVYSVTAQKQGYSNVVEDQSYSANPGFPANSGLQPGSSQQVWLADGINDQWQQTPSQGSWPVFNRVVFGSFDSGSKQWTINYLNGSQIDSAGLKTPMAQLEPSDVTLNYLYTTLGSTGNGPTYTFSAASTPTVITLAGQPGDTFANSTAVFWVEASEPVIPVAVKGDGSTSYQDFLDQLYGSQQINYRIKKPNGTWQAPPTLSPLYAPADALIRHLKAFNVEMDGDVRTLLVWDETSIATIKGMPAEPIAINCWIDANRLTLTGASNGLRIGDLISGNDVKQGSVVTGIIMPFDPQTKTGVYRLSTSQSLGSSSQLVALNATPLLPPTVLKAGFLNPDANTIQWSDLFSVGGSTTITTIPWDQTNDIGVGIESLSVASKQVVDASGQVRDTAVLSWSEDVRTPYVESVLNDQPLIYLQFADLQPGVNDINIGSTASETTTSTSASNTGLNFTVASALSKSSGSAVQNIDGTGVIATGTGSQNRLYNSIFNSTPINQRPSSPLSQLTGTITGTTLTLTALSGELAVGDLLTGQGLAVDTQITAVLSAFDAATGTGQYSINTAPPLNLTTSTALEAVPNPAPTSSKDLGLPYSGFSGSINGTTLTVSQLNGRLAVGDLIIGEGVKFGTSISAVLNVDARGLGDYQLNADPLQQGTNLAPSALIATPISSVPYTIEFWTKLPPGSNRQGAGLVAFGQPSTGAVGPAVAPSGWLMTSIFTVQRITVQQAAAEGFRDAIDLLEKNSATANDLYAWGWSLDATGANTTALNGNGGSNVYSNALSLSNLYSGQVIGGVAQFLNSYGLQPGDLPGGDGLDATTIALVPGTSLDFNISLDPDTGLPVSNLNAVGIDTASSLLNSGLVFARDGQLSSDSSKDKSLKDMFQSLWDYQEAYASAKVAFSLDPKVAGTPPKSGFEQYGGLELAFSVSPGPALSVNQEGMLVFDVADGVSITSDATSPSDRRQSPLPADLRDDQWHHVVATYLPDYRAYTINGVATQVPTNSGTASLYIDNQLVASRYNVANAYRASNINDTALLLPNNAGGSIDQFALYNKALLTAPPLLSNPSGLWPQANKSDVLAILKDLGYPATADTPNPGAIDSAITEHWRSRDVNPNNAILATFSSTFSPSSSGSLSGSWSEAAPLNPIYEVQATIPSASAASLAQDVVISIKADDWSKNIWGNGSSTASFNPGGDTLKQIIITLTPDQADQSTVTRQLSPSQVLMGDSTTLAVLQPMATSSDLKYTFLSSAPVLNLLVSRAANTNNAIDSGDLDPSTTYNAQIDFHVNDASSASGNDQVYSTTITGFNGNGSKFVDAFSGTGSNASAASLINKRTTALATAAVIEQAPLQLKYINSGVVLKSATSQQAANNPAAPSPAPTFGQSMAYGWFKAADTTYSGWLAVAQPSSANAISDPAGRAWIQYTGDFTSSDPGNKPHAAVSDTDKAPNTWLNALANSNFSPEAPNRPLLNDKTHPSSSGGLLVKADPTLGWGQNFAQTMLVADVNDDGVLDLVISAPSANSGGKVVIIDGNWIKDNLNSSTANSTLNLASPDNAGTHVLVLSPDAGTSSNEDPSQSAFGWSLAFDPISKTLYIGAPNYSRKVGPDAESVPIGAVYQYKSSTKLFTSGNQSLSKPTVGIAGSTEVNDIGGQSIGYWGARLGASLAASAEGDLAIGAPGVQASLLYSGTEAVNQLLGGNKNPSDPYGQGALIKLMLPAPEQSSDGIDVYVSSNGTDNSLLTNVFRGSTTNFKSSLGAQESAYMTALKALQTKPIAKASPSNNSALQTAAVGSVYYIKKGTQLPSASTLKPELASATFYGPNPWNTTGDTDFGASLTYGDVSNTNLSSILSIGAPSTGGPGAVYLINTANKFETPDTAAEWVRNSNIGTGSSPNQYLAHLVSGLTLYGAGDLDQFGAGVVNLGDTNGDSYDDLLVQAPNASSGAGNGYVVFGSDQLIKQLNDNQGKNSSIEKLFGGHNPALGSVKTGSIGSLTFADSSTLTTPILSLLGHGVAAATGQGSFGAGDVDANGNHDILLGSGSNGQAYLTKGHDYLKAVGNLQLQKLASNTGYLLEGLATKNQGSLRSIGDFNGDGYGDYFSRKPGTLLDTVRIELGANTQDILASYNYNYYTFQVDKGTDVIPVGDVNGDGYSDIALFLQTNLTSPLQGNAGAGSTTGILYGRASTILPLGAGFGYLAPVSDGNAADGLTGQASNPEPANTPLTELPGVNPDGGLSNVDPSFLAVGDHIYCVVKGWDNNNLYYNQSADGGNTWAGWTNLTDANSSFKSWNSPSLAWHQDKLYLAYLNPSNQLTLANWDPNSGNASAWSNPSAVGDGTTVFSSRFRPQLLSDGSALSISWVGLDGTTVGNGNLYSSISTNPDGLWQPVASGGSSAFNPAMARDGDKIYMARLAADNTLYWTQSTDAGQTWADWQQLPTGMTSDDAPSLAIVGGELYLTYLGKGNQYINITKLSDASQNQWEQQVYFTDKTAKSGCGAVAIAEMVNGIEELAIYYVMDDSTGTIYRTSSGSPLITSSYSTSTKLGTQDYAPGYSASGALAATTFNGTTYLAYPGGTPDSKSSVAYIASPAGQDPSTGTNWTNITSLDTGNTLGIGLSSNSTGLLLNTTDSATNQQATYLLKGASGSLQFYGSRASASVDATQKTASILSVPASAGNPEVLLEAVAEANHNKTVSVSTNIPLWLSQQQLLERTDANGTLSFAPINVTAAPTATLLNGVPVLAVNNSGTILVYSAAGGRTFTLNSSFSPGDANAAGKTAAGLTSTETGLALSYLNADGSVSLQRLNFLKLDGTPVNGVVINSDGSIDTSKANLQWEGINLASSSGVSTALATTPLNVNGTLQLGSVSNSTSEQYQVQFHALPALSNPESLTWLNTTVQLPDGKGGWLVQQQASANAPTALNPSWTYTYKKSSKPPVFTQDPTTGRIYAAIEFTDNRIYWNYSTTGGSSWNAWAPLDASITTATSPAITVLNGTLVLAYVGQDDQKQINITTAPIVAEPSSLAWTSQYQITGLGAKSISLVTEGSNVALYYQGTNDQIYRAYTSSPTTNEWNSNPTPLQFDPNNSAAYQSCSGQLVATTIAATNTTYLAYRGGNTAAPSNTFYITFSANQGDSSTWRAINNVPQPNSPTQYDTNNQEQLDVGLTNLNGSLVLSYADLLSDQPVLALQQGVVNAGNWSGAPYALLKSLGGTSTPQSSLLAPSGSTQVLVGSINASKEIDTTLTAAQPLSQLLGPNQSGSTLTPVGDITGDGLADMLLTANNVVAEFSSGRQLATGLRIITGAATSTAIAENNKSTLDSQTVQLASPFPNGSTTPVAMITGADPASGSLNLGIAARNDSSLHSINATGVSASSLITAVGSVTAASILLDGIKPSTATLLQSQGWGDPALNGTGSYGDLNGDGRPDFFDPSGNVAINVDPSLLQLAYSLWSIRPAGDVNGNGVDDVILTLSPNGPAYGQVVSGQPSALQSVLLDGSLFSVKNSQFSLAQADGSAKSGWTSAGLKIPLNPYNTKEYADLSSTDDSAYIPSLQNWFEPIQGYAPGALTAAATKNVVNPDSALSYAPPAAAVNDAGQAYLVYSGKSTNSDGAGLWMAYQDSSGNWSQINLTVGGNASFLSPSAVFYQGKLTIAYSDINGDLHVAWCDGSPQDSSSTWNSYQVKTDTNNSVSESSQWNPTLVAEQGRLALYFPSNAGSTQQQTIRYLYSTNPFNTSAYGNWGSSLTGTSYSGVSGTLSASGSNPAVSSPIAATTYQGRTVLAFRGFDNNLDSSHIWMATQVAPPDPSGKLSWASFDTQQSGTNGVGLATDQAALYLTSTTSAYGTYYQNPQPQMWSLTPQSLSEGTWSLGSSHNVDGPGFSPQTNLVDNPLSTKKYNSGTGSAEMKINTAVVPYLANGRLYAAWSGASGQGYNPGIINIYTIQSGDLSLSLDDSDQLSLAGYSIDANIDINGDGFKDVLISDPSDPAKSVNNQYALFGGDYLNIASQVGTPGDDVMLGTPLSDVIYSLQGSDQVVSNGGKDVIYTGAGDDSISIQDNDFIRIDAGAGFNTLKLEGRAHQSYDFSLNVQQPVYFCGTQLNNIQLISSIDYGANSLVFDQAGVNSMNSDRVLFLSPDATDSISLSSEFSRALNFDASLGGRLWSAYSAGPVLATNGNNNPTLIYVGVPTGQSADTWLDQNVSIDPAFVATATTLRSSPAPAVMASAAPPSAASVIDSPPLPMPKSGQTRTSQTPFAGGLILKALPSTSQSASVRFLVERVDTSLHQAVLYSTSSLNAEARLGRDVLPAVGLVIFNPGDSVKEIHVPLNISSLQQLRASSVSLQVEEIPYRSWLKELHLAITPNQDVTTGVRPVLSGVDLVMDPSTWKAQLSFRVDTTDSSLGSDVLGLSLARRESASDLQFTSFKTITINDYKDNQGLSVPTDLRQLPLDRDQSSNHQVEVSFQLDLSQGNQNARVSLLGPDLVVEQTVQQAGTNQIRFQQDTPLTSWRSDSGSGLVTFGIQAGSTSQTLLTAASGGTAGSIDPARALDNNPGGGWQGSEGLAVGSRSITTVANLSAQAWTPTATRNGVALNLQDIRINGNQVTARFQDGVSVEFWQASGTAPSLVPIAPAVEVKRLAGYNNAIGFYSVDSITGRVDGRDPGDAGYLQAALARSEAEKLLLSAADLPAFGQSATFNALPLTTQQRYGVLLLQNGDRNTMFSSFSAANPGGETQMVRLGSDPSSYVLGIEDIAVASGLSDSDFNDNILTLSGVSLGLF